MLRVCLSVYTRGYPISIPSFSLGGGTPVTIPRSFPWGTPVQGRYPVPRMRYPNLRYGNNPVPQSQVGVSQSQMGVPLSGTPVLRSPARTGWVPPGQAMLRQVTPRVVRLMRFPAGELSCFS